MESNNTYICYKVEEINMNKRYYKIVVQNGETVHKEISFREYEEFCEFKKQVTEHQNKLS